MYLRVCWMHYIGELTLRRMPFFLLNVAAHAFFFPINVHFLSEYARRISNPILFFCGVCWIHLRVCWMQYIVARFFLLSVAAYASLFTEYSA